MKLLRIIQLTAILTTVAGLIRQIIGEVSPGEGQGWTIIICGLVALSIIIKYFTDKGEIHIFGRRFYVIDKEQKELIEQQCKVIDIKTVQRRKA